MIARHKDISAAVRAPRLWPAMAALALAGAAWAQTASAPNPAAVPPAQAVPVPVGSGIDRSTFDTTVRPQDDLYRALNGHWIKTTPIPDDKAAYGAGYEVLDRADEHVRKIVEELASAKHAPGSTEQKIGDFYKAFLDEAAIDRAGLAPLTPWLAEIDALRTPADLARMFGRLQGIANTPMAAVVDSDPKQPSVYRTLLYQSGLGLPDRDYYIKNDNKLTEARKAYRTYAETLLRLAGDADAAKHADRVLALEKKIAQAHWSSVANRDPVKTYNPMTPAELAKFAPGFDWAEYFTASALPTLDRVSVSQPSYAKAMATLVHSAPLADWQIYLKVQVIDSFTLVLPQAFRTAQFSFRGRALNGQQQQKPRWKLAGEALDAAMGEAVGKAYVARHFPPANKARMQDMIGNLMLAYRASIDTLTWMGEATKQRARDKLAKYMVKVGYPDKWRDYSALQIRAGDALGNSARAGRFEQERTAKRAGQPVDRTEWLMSPQTVNAYYNATMNEIVFPAGILQPPFFDMVADDAANYGATGATIGHEISHGFDDEGSQYDGDGKLENWWTEADRKAFDKLTKKLVAQFNTYEPLPGRKLNGKLTLGENIADLSGLEIAYKAYQLSLKGKPAPVIDGMTGDERFFYAYAQSWREKEREERALRMLTMDPHAPPEFRANGAVVNIDAFHRVFNTKPGDGMYKAPKERIRIW